MHSSSSTIVISYIKLTEIGNSVFIYLVTLLAYNIVCELATHLTHIWVIIATSINIIFFDLYHMLKDAGISTGCRI